MTSKSKEFLKAIKLEEQDRFFISKTTKNERGIFSFIPKVNAVRSLLE